MSRESKFVVLEHAGTEGVHWDLMLEDAGALLTWRLERLPEQIGSEPVQAERIHEHPVRFLKYEGPVQRNTAAVRRVDAGACRWVYKEAHVLSFGLEGQILKGNFRLTCSGGTEWVLQRL